MFLVWPYNHNCCCFSVLFCGVELTTQGLVLEFPAVACKNCHTETDLLTFTVWSLCSCFDLSEKYLPFSEVHIFYSWSKMNYESTIAFVGQWRYFQKMIFFLLCTSMVPNGLLAFFIVFVGDTPDHHCQIPDVNLTQEWLNTTIPKEVISLFKTYFAFSICFLFSHLTLIPLVKHYCCCGLWNFSYLLYTAVDSECSTIVD